MTSVVSEARPSRSIAAVPRARVVPRDTAIDAMRGIAILMVIGIHALHAQAYGRPAVLLDAALRPCVPIFLFASGYLTARAGAVPLAKRIKAVLPPYIVAFAAAYLYMALHNPAMDHRPAVTAARFVLAYVFVYYYVFVYLGCTVALWLVFGLARPQAAGAQARLVALSLAAIAFGLTVGAYLDPALSRFGLSDSLIEEVRLRDIPFWFSFMAAGALAGLWDIRAFVAQHRGALIAFTALAYAIYASVRVTGIGDAAAYDSLAFFLYALALSLTLLALSPDTPALATLGAGSYFIYLWHIFFVLALRDHTALADAGAVMNFIVVYAVTLIATAALLFAVRRLQTPSLARWTGA